MAFERMKFGKPGGFGDSINVQSPQITLPRASTTQPIAVSQPQPIPSPFLKHPAPKSVKRIVIAVHCWNCLFKIMRKYNEEVQREKIQSQIICGKS